MFRRFSDFFSSLSATKQFFFARTFYDWGFFVFDTFYMAFVFKESGDVRQVIYNILAVLLTVMGGFLLGSWLLTKIGVEWNLRLSFLLYIVTGLLGMYLINVGWMSYLLLSVVRGISEGIFWASLKIIELSGLNENSRSRFYSVSHGVNELFFIIAPVSLGYLLSTADSLYPAFFLFTVIFLVAASLPYKFPMKEEISFSWQKFQRIFRAPKITFYTLTKMNLALVWMLDWLLFSLVPFVILGNEVNVGIYLTISACIGIIITFMTNRFSLAKKTTWGLPFILLSTLADTLLAINFTPVMLYVNSILLSLSASVIAPLEQDLSVTMTAAVDRKKDLGVELNLYQESMYTVARILLGGAVLLVIAGGVPLLALLRGLIILLALCKLMNYFLSIRFLRKNI